MARRNFQQMSLVDQFHNIRPKRGELPHSMLLRILLLQQWYGLSNREAELSIEDSLSFRRFAGIPLEQKAPDHTRIWAFR